MSLRNVFYSFLKPASLRAALRAVIPADAQQRFRNWLQGEPNVQWCRVVMNREIERFIRSLDCPNIDVLEISGTGSQGRYNFHDYKTVEFPEYDICNGPLVDEGFDLIIAEQVFEHVLRPDLAAESVYKMLRPGGVFVISTPFLLKVHGAPSDLYRWTEHGMKQLLEGAGFNVLSTGSWGNRECMFADMTSNPEWTVYKPRRHSLLNEPQFAIVVWAFAEKRGGIANLHKSLASEHYTKSFFEELRKGAQQSADVIVPLVLELLPVRNVVDVGCGDGTWLAAFQKHGVEEILGLDGEYVSNEVLQIPEKCFQAVDLTKPFELRRSFDLAVSLEVAEHLPVESAATLVESLTRLSPLVLFSAAIPFQGGENHMNEQWPDKWAALFQKHDYLPVDFIRKRVWQNEAVNWWYAQNTLLFVKASLLDCNPKLKAEFEATNRNQLSLVHPRGYL
jgi:SAM-dependent methyltransferase